MSTRLPAVLNSNFVMTAELHPIECSVRLNIEPMSQSEMTVMADEAPDVRGWVEVFTPHGSAGIFRVSRRESSYVEGEVHITLDHGICTLMDDLAPEGASEGNTLYYSGTPQQVLTQILAKQTSGNLYWQVGSAPNTGSVKIDVEWENLLDLLTKLMDELPGYMLTFDQTTNPWTVGIAARPSSVSAEGRLSRNVTSARITLDDSDMCTRVYADALPEPHYLTSTTSSTYGIIAQKLNTADGITEQQAEDICTAYLDIHDHPAVSVEIDGAELCQLTGDSFDELKIGKLYRLAIPDYGVVQEECITSLYYSAVYDNPLGVQITLANDAKDLTSHLTKVQKAVKSAGRGAARAEEKADEAASGYVDYTHYKEETDQKFSLLYKETDWDAAYEEKQRKGEEYETILEQTARKFSLLATESIYNSATAANPLIGQLQSSLEVTARKIQSTVSATGLALNADGTPQTDSDGNYIFNGSHNSLDSQITQKAGQIQTLITKTGINSLGNAETLYSKIDQTYNSFSVLIDSNTGTVSPASLILAINGTGGSSATISADKIDLHGYVTADEIFVTSGTVTYLDYGNIRGNTITTSNLVIGSSSSGGTSYDTFTPSTIHMGPITVGGNWTGTFLGTTGTLNLTHAHEISCDSSGVVTLGDPCAVGDQAANFNIADTTYFRNAVSAVINSLAVTQGSTTNQAVVSVRSTATGQSGSKTLTVSADGWTASGRTVNVKEDSASYASVTITPPSMSGDWIGTTGSGASTSNTYRVNEKDGQTIIGAATGHQVSIYLTQGTQSGNSLPIFVRAGSTSGTIVAKDFVTVSGGGSATVDSIAINGTVTDGTTSTAVKLNVPVSAYDAQDNVLKSATLTPVVPSSIYTPTVEVSISSSLRTGGRWIDVTAVGTATTAGGLGSGTTTQTYARYIGNYLDDAKAEGAEEVTLTHQTWSDQSNPSANYSYTLSPGHNRKFQVNASNGQKLSCLMTAPSLSATNWTRTNFSRDTQQYNNGKALSILVSVTVGGVVFSNTFTTAALKVYRYSNAYVSVRFGSTEIGRFYLDSDE